MSNFLIILFFVCVSLQGRMRVCKKSRNKGAARCLTVIFILPPLLPTLPESFLKVKLTNSKHTQQINGSICARACGCLVRQGGGLYFRAGSLLPQSSGTLGSDKSVSKQWLYHFQLALLCFT